MSVKIASLYAEISADSRKLISALTGAKSGLGGLKSNMKAATIVVGAITGAFGAAGVAVVKLANEYTAYADQVKAVTRLTGMQAETASRLIQAADDMFVSQGTLTSALQFSIRQGYQPSVEWLGKMSDKILSMPPGAERAAEAIKLFGRQAGPEMLKMMEQGSAGIDKMMAAVESGLVITEKGIQLSDQYKTATDGLSDAAHAAKIRLAELVMPQLLSFLDYATEKTQTFSARLNTIGTQQTQKKLKELALEANGLRDQMTRLHNEGLSHLPYYRELEASLMGVTGEIGLLSGELTRAELGMESGALATEELADGLGDVERATADAIEQVQSFSANFGSIINYAIEYTDIQEQIAEKQARIALLSDAASLRKLGISAQDAQKEIGILTGDIGELQGQLDKLAAKVVWDMAMVTAAIGGVSEEEGATMIELGVKLGMFSQDAADKAVEMWRSAIEQISGLNLNTTSTHTVLTTYTYAQQTQSGKYNPFLYREATGGSFSGWGIVGDAPGGGYSPNQELVYAPHGATVIPANQTQSILAGGSFPSHSSGGIIPPASPGSVELSSITIRELARAIGAEIGRMNG